jgi:hypothetical protein
MPKTKIANTVNLGTQWDIDPDVDRDIELGKASALTRLRPAKIRFYLRVMQQQGFNHQQVLRGTGIDPRHLADQHYLVEISKYIRIISNINALCGSASLAFRLGEQLTLGDLGLLGYCVMTSDNTDEATWLWHQYNPHIDPESRQADARDLCALFQYPRGFTEVSRRRKNLL